MTDFQSVLRCYLIEVLTRSGMSVLERDFGVNLHWDGDEIRDDDDIDKFKNNIRSAAEAHATNILDALVENGFREPNDIIDRREDLLSLLSKLIEQFEKEIREGTS